MTDSVAATFNALLTSLWDWSDPAGSERSFRALAESSPPDHRLLALTQVARALGLQERYDEGRAVLDEVAVAAEGAGGGAAHGAAREVAVRVALERGRLRRSEGLPGQATPLFQEAADLAADARLEALHVDALHMLAMDGDPQEQIRRTRAALEVARASTSEGARRWDASLLNNLGMAQHDAGDLPAALESFEAALELREARGQDREARIARWMVAWTLRLLGRTDEARRMQRALKAELTAAGEQDTYVDQELALLEEDAPDGPADASEPEVPSDPAD
jgi:tetratricopeptide (TPR) repeat protein